MAGDWERLSFPNRFKSRPVGFVLGMSAASTTKPVRVFVEKTPVEFCAYKECYTNSTLKHRKLFSFPEPCIQYGTSEEHDGCFQCVSFDVWAEACARKNQIKQLKIKERITKIRKEGLFVCDRHFAGGNGPTQGFRDPIPYQVLNSVKLKDKNHGTAARTKNGGPKTKLRLKFDRKVDSGSKTKTMADTILTNGKNGKPKRDKEKAMSPKKMKAKTPLGRPSNDRLLKTNVGNVKFCSYAHCSNTSANTPYAFIPFPKPCSKLHRDSVTISCTCKHCAKFMLWAVRSGKKTLLNKKYVKDKYICARHFIDPLKGPTELHPHPLPCYGVNGVDAPMERVDGGGAGAPSTGSESEMGDEEDDSSDEGGVVTASKTPAIVGIKALPVTPATPTGGKRKASLNRSKRAAKNAKILTEGNVKIKPSKHDIGNNSEGSKVIVKANGSGTRETASLGNANCSPGRMRNPKVVLKRLPSILRAMTPDKTPHIIWKKIGDGSDPLKCGDFTGQIVDGEGKPIFIERFLTPILQRL